MSGLPGGAVTFLFTDIEGSTRLVKALRERYPQALAEHRRLVRAAIAAHGGHEVDTQGDAFFVAFAGAKQAVLCALEIQRALAGHDWPAGAPVRVRIGIHTGHAVPAESVYTGLAVHRAARICAAAAGGQVLVSQATQTIIEDEEEDPGFTLSDLGEHTLKDLDRPVRLFQLAAAGLDTRAPPAGQPAGRSARAMSAAPPGAEPGAFAAAATRALPRDTAAFTGRQAELARLLGEVGSLAAGGGVVGIHAIDGMAGIGKTTLAVHAAHQLAPSFPDGQFFLPLRAHTPGQRPVDPADALASLLLTAGVAAPQIPPGLEARACRWRDQVAGKKVLLLLDDAAGHEQVEPLLPGTVGSLVLVTSRRRLTALEDAAVISLDTLPAAEAAALLARLAARPGLHAGDAAVAEITGLCGYLPLAIGMLASQLRHHPAWTVNQLATDLAAARDKLALMRAENLSVAAAFGLSYTDLSQDQQRLFRRLGLVPGPDFDAYAAAAIEDTPWPPPGATLMGSMTTICSPNPPPAATVCTTCSASTPAPWPPQTTLPSQTLRPAGYWTITCTPRPPAGISSPGTAPPAAQPPGGRDTGSVHRRAGRRLAGSRAGEPARRHGRRRWQRAIPACHRHTRRHWWLPGRPWSLGSVRRPPPDRLGRGAPGRRPGRRGRDAR
jgi:class 3 adenylate cyclase